jgi:hypothetical protein
MPITVEVHDETIQAIEDGINANETAAAAAAAAAAASVQPGDDAADLGSGAAADGHVLTADGAGGAAWEAPSGGGGGHVIEDEGTPLTQRAALNFVGAGVAVTDDAGNDATVVTISGGGSTPLSDADPEALAAAADSGVSTDASRADHVHPRPTPADIGAPATNPTGITGASTVTNIVRLSQANYDAIGTPNASTLYIIEA